MPARPSPRVLLAAVAALGLAAAALLVLRPQTVQAAPDSGSSDDAASGVEVGGVGTASGRPDVLRFDVGVEVSADGVDAALSGADDAARAVVDALDAAGVPGEDVQTRNVSVFPRYSDRGEQITGYTASHQLSVTLRDVTTAGSVLASVADAGGDATRIGGISFALDDDAAVRAQAREAAFADARQRAEQYAELVGRELGDVLWVRENVTTPAPPVPYAAEAAADAGGSLRLEPGSTEVTVTAEVRWSLR